MEINGIGDCAARHIKHRVRKLIGRFGFTASDREDLEQDLATDLLQRQKYFNAAKAQYGTFAVRVIDHRISTLLAKRQLAMRDYRRETCSLDEPVPDDDRVLVSRHETVDAERDRPGLPAEELGDLAADVRQAVARLPKRLRRVCLALMSSAPHEVVDELKVPKSTLYRDIAAIRQALAAAGLEDYLKKNAPGVGRFPDRAGR